MRSCRVAVGEHDAQRAVRELVEELVSDPARVASALPVPERSGFVVLHRAPDLTVLDFTWAPWMCFKPHDHRMPSIVGIFAGREDNVMWRRVPGRIEAAGARSLGTGEVATLGREIIHSVVNPTSRATRAVHVYLGDFFDPPEPRAEWDPETLEERPWDVEHTRRLFAEGDARARSR